MAAADVRASKLVEASRGAETHPLAFYSTSYSAAHGATAEKSAPRRPSGGGPGPPPAPFVAGINPVTGKAVRRPRRTGYSKNLVPYVEYSKEVDEDEYFNEDSHFVTNNSVDYRPPQSLPDLRGIPRYVNVEQVLDSGFTRTRTNNRDKPVEPPAATEGLTSTAKRDFADFTPVYLTRICGRTVNDVHGNPLPRWRADVGARTDTAYTSNATAVHRFGDHNEFLAVREDRERELREARGPPRERNVSRVDVDGYTRQNQLDEYIGKPPGKLKNADAGPAAMPSEALMSSMTRLSYQKPAVSFRCLDKSFAIGKKQPSGALRNLPEFLRDHDVPDPERFRTVAQESYQNRANETRLEPIDLVPPSGYTKGNNTFPPMDKVPREIRYVHPTVLAAQNLRDRGLYQNAVIV